MKDYLSIANSKTLYFSVLLLLVLVFCQAIIFLVMALRRGKELKINKDKMVIAFRSGIVSSILPSIAIVLAFFAMAPALGIPVSWGRLSIIGSLAYEIMAAGVGATAMGVDGLGGSGYTPEVFANSVWVMTFGSIWSITICALFLNKIKNTYKKRTDKDNKWASALISAAYLGLMASFVTPSLVEGGTAIIALFSSAVFMIILVLLIKKFKIRWLKEFALALSMIGAMICSVLF